MVDYGRQSESVISAVEEQVHIKVLVMDANCIYCTKSKVIDTQHDQGLLW